MNVRTRRRVAGAGVGALALFATTAALASPARAAESSADVSVTVASTKVAVGASGKIFRIDLVNDGPDAAADTVLNIDLSGLDAEKVVADPSTLPEICTASKANIVCKLGEGAARETLSFPLTLNRVEDAKEGPAGSLTVEVASATNDPKPENNKASADIEIAPSGVDLTVDADDVYQIDEKGESTGEPVPPGEVTLLSTFIVNQGDTAANGLAFTAKLPEHVSFSPEGRYDFCSYSSDGRTADCQVDDLQLVPIEKADPDNDVYGAIDVPFVVEVAEDAPGPATPRGTFTASAVHSDETARMSTLAKAALPKGITALTTTEAENEVKDVDAGDNVDEYTVFIGAAASGGGGGGGTGGGLPVTGVQVGLIGGVGAAVLALGAVLFVLSRRRRVVLVTPGDEEPTA
jgi:hypothetical protein